MELVSGLIVPRPQRQFYGAEQLVFCLQQEDNDDGVLFRSVFGI